METHAGHILGEEALIQPQGTGDLRFHIQLFPNLPDNGIFCRFMEFDSSSGKIVIGGILILCCKDLSVVKDDGADPVVENTCFAFECQIHRSLHRKQKKPIIPQVGTKGNPSAVPPAIRRFRRSFKSAFTLAVFNGTTRRTLLSFQAAAHGRKPGIARKRIPPSRSLYRRKPMQGSPVTAVHISGTIVAHPAKKCKYQYRVYLKKAIRVDGPCVILWAFLNLCRCFCGGGDGGEPDPPGLPSPPGGRRLRQPQRWPHRSGG